MHRPREVGWLLTVEFENFEQKRQVVLVLEGNIFTKDVQAQHVRDILPLQFLQKGKPDKLEKRALDDAGVRVEVVDKKCHLLECCLFYYFLNFGHVIVKNGSDVIVHEKGDQSVLINVFRQPFIAVQFVNAIDLRLWRAKSASHYTVIYGSDLTSGNEELQLEIGNIAL